MQLTRGEMMDHLAKFSTEKGGYRQALVDDPKGVIAKQFGLDIPGHVNVKVVEDSADTVHIVLPHVVEAGAELSDADLEAVAGGMAMVKEAKCESGMLNTVIAIG